MALNDIEARSDAELRFTFTVTATLGGVTGPLQIQSNSIRGIKLVLGDLQAHDLLAPTPQEQQQTAPVCQYHGPMKESTKRPGTWFCPQKMGDGSYCKSKA